MAGVERGFVKPRSKCEGCPFAGSCTPCRPQTLQFGKKAEAVKVIEELFSKTSPGLRDGKFIFGPARQGGAEPPKTNKIICFICKEETSTCRHSKSEASALAAA